MEVEALVGCRDFFGDFCATTHLGENVRTLFTMDFLSGRLLSQSVGEGGMEQLSGLDEGRVFIVSVPEGNDHYSLLRFDL